MAVALFQKLPLRLLSSALIAAVLLGEAGFARADDTQPKSDIKSDRPKYSDSGRVEGLFVGDKAKCEALCRRAYRPGYELSNDICIATCVHYPN
jgi:hypothetical protein